MRYAKMSNDQLIEMLFNIVEKKAIEDKFRENKGIALASFSEFIEDFMLNKYGLENVAFGKLQSMVTSLLKHGRKRGLRFKYARVGAAMCGLVNPSKYSPDIGAVIIRIVRSLFPQHDAINEQLRANQKALRRMPSGSGAKGAADPPSGAPAMPTAARS